MTDERSIEAQVDVPGTPEEVWAAVATGAGISSWYVPHTVEEAEGGAITASFGPGMDVAGRVSAWDPPHRFTIDGGDDGPGLAFEWFVEAREGGGCTVRLVNSGFGSGGDWDDQFDAMRDGWEIFLTNLRLHRENFPGQVAVAALPMAMWSCDRNEAWTRLTTGLGIEPGVEVGAMVAAHVDAASALVGTVHARGPHRLSLVITEPGPGTAFIAAEGSGDVTSVSIWIYVYGSDAAPTAAAFAESWSTWLAAAGTDTG